MYGRIPAKDHISLRRQEPTKGMEKLHNHSSHSLEPVVPFDTKGMLCTWHVYSNYEYQTTICLKTMIVLNKALQHFNLGSRAVIIR